MPAPSTPNRTDTPAAGTIERRVIAFAAGEIRADDNQRRLAGYAAKFNHWTEIGWFRERIKPGAFDGVLKTSDARALKNHDPNLLLGRESSGTLRLSTNSVGLKFEIDVPDTTTGRDTLEEVRRGDLAGCSFAFTVDEEEWKYAEDAPPQRTIVRIGALFDVGPVTYPAYEDTTVVARSAQAFACRTEPAGPHPGGDDEDAARGVTPNDASPAVSDESRDTSNDNTAATIDATRQRSIERKYRHARRIIDRNRLADVQPVAPGRDSGSATPPPKTERTDQ